MAAGCLQQDADGQTRKLIIGGDGQRVVFALVVPAVLLSDRLQSLPVARAGSSMRDDNFSYGKGRQAVPCWKHGFP